MESRVFGLELIREIRKQRATIDAFDRLEPYRYVCRAMVISGQRCEIKREALFCRLSGSLPELTTTNQDNRRSDVDESHLRAASVSER